MCRSPDGRLRLNEPRQRWLSQACGVARFIRQNVGRGFLCCRTGRNEGTPSWERGENKIRQKSAFPPLPNGFSLGLPFPSPSPPLPIFRRRAPCNVSATALITPFDALNCSDCSHATSEHLLFCSEFMRAFLSRSYLHRNKYLLTALEPFLYCKMPLSILVSGFWFT